MVEFVGFIGLCVSLVAEIVGLIVIFRWAIKQLKHQQYMLDEEIVKGELIKEVGLKYEYGKISEDEFKNELYELETL